MVKEAKKDKTLLYSSIIFLIISTVMMLFGEFKIGILTINLFLVGIILFVVSLIGIVASLLK